MRILLPASVALSAICATAGLGAEDQPRFETASVKRTERGFIKNSMGPGTVIMKGDPLKIVLMEAFQVKGYEIVGPAWLDEDCFEIFAKMPEGTTRDQIPAMLQALLAERFKLAAHKEDRLRPMYALVVEKGGPKFKEAKLNFRRTGLRPGQVAFRATNDAHGFKGAMTMALLAHFLSGSLDRPVKDFTGLKGTYEIDLSWAPDATIERAAGAGGSFAAATAEAGAASANEGGELPAAPTATLFTAIRESLGLRLQARKRPVEMLVIGRVKRVPTEN